MSKKTYEMIALHPPSLRVKVGNKIYQGTFYRGKDFADIHLSTGTYRIALGNKKSRKSSVTHAEGSLSSPMPGKVIKVLVKEKQSVKKGELLFILEAMKMEHKVLAPHDGCIQKILFKEGERVSQGEDLVELS